MLLGEELQKACGETSSPDSASYRLHSRELLGSLGRSDTSAVRLPVLLAQGAPHPLQMQG